MNFNHSLKALDYIQRLKKFMERHVLPLERELWQENGEDWTKWRVHPHLEVLKDKARGEGLWNLFLPSLSGLSNTEYAPLAEIMGQIPAAAEIFNCNAPDTGNMELLEKYASPAQKEMWLEPLLEGKIRSVFCMTEPDVASSDATNMQATIQDAGEEIILNGKKWWSTGLGHPHCKLAIFMGLSNPNAPRHAQHSMVLVPLDAKGVTIQRMLPVFNSYDAPYGHGEVHFENVVLPKSSVIAGLGRGFEIAQGRLGPGRVHHCMRAIGATERALQLLIQRARTRVAFGKPLYQLGGNSDIIAHARMDIDMARLLVLKTAFLLDTVGIKGAMSEVSQIKVVVPNLACRIIDQAIQIHGGMGVCNDTVLTSLFLYGRMLRIADGPDEVHRQVVAKQELLKYKS